MTMTFNYPETMVLNGTEYNVNHLMTDPEAHSMTKNNFIQQIYTKYVAIRIAVGGNRCAKMSLEQVKNELKTGKYDSDLRNILKLSEKDVETVLYIAENHISIIR